MDSKQQVANNRELSSDWWESISQSEKESYERGLKDWKEGRVQSHDDVKPVYQKYLQN
ncbi:hypothetical protein [uncultured Arcticibacterium sp.]|uniref:hypothetical protein n=1 Tax=uncultured Arcticibacterium sp. TaxID=2173042 RepID=UPI0030FA8636